MDNIQKELIQRLYELLIEINEQAINDDKFNHWLNQNYFFEEDLEEINVEEHKEFKETKYSQYSFEGLEEGETGIGSSNYVYAIRKGTEDYLVSYDTNGQVTGTYSINCRTRYSHPYATYITASPRKGHRSRSKKNLQKSSMIAGKSLKSMQTNSPTQT